MVSSAGNLALRAKMKATRDEYVAKKKSLNTTQVRQVKKIIDKVGETKHHTLVTGLTSVDALTPHNVCLSLVSQGDNDSQRNGDKIDVKNLNIRLRMLYPNNTASDPLNSNFRVMVIQDKNYNTASAVTALHVLTAVTNTSQRNVDHLKSKVVLFDKLYQLDRAGPTAKTVIIKPNLKFLKRGIQYAVSSTTDQTGGIYLLIINDQNSVTDNQIEYSARMTYTDK